MKFELIFHPELYQFSRKPNYLLKVELNLIKKETYFLEWFVLPIFSVLPLKCIGIDTMCLKLKMCIRDFNGKTQFAIT